MQSTSPLPCWAFRSPPGFWRETFCPKQSFLPLQPYCEWRMRFVSKLILFRKSFQGEGEKKSRLHPTGRHKPNAPGLTPSTYAWSRVRSSVNTRNPFGGGEPVWCTLAVICQVDLFTALPKRKQFSSRFLKKRAQKACFFPDAHHSVLPLRKK